MGSSLTAERSSTRRLSQCHFGYRLEFQILDLSASFEGMSGNNAGMRRRKVEPLLARDVYAEWKARVKDACDSIVVFTPYLDALVVRLLFHSAMDADRLVVVTDLSPTTGALNYLAQLRAIAKLLDRGISVRSLERLHAKVLMTDGKFVTVGSQNFTTFARNSHEATSVPDTDLSDSVFVQTLNTWLADATPIDSELIELLLTEVKLEAIQVQESNKVLLAAIGAVREDHRAEVERRRALEAAAKGHAARARFSAMRLRGLASAQRSRIAQGEAIIQRDLVWSSSGHWYPTQKANATASLTAWIVGAGPATRRVTLDRAYWYPVMNAGSGRMSWARIVKTRITYVKSGVIFTMQRLFENTPVKVQVNFPSSRTLERNIVFTFTELPFEFAECTVEALFDGERLNLVESRNTGIFAELGELGEGFRALCEAQFEDEEVAIPFSAPALMTSGSIRLKSTITMSIHSLIRSDTVYISLSMLRHPY